MLECVLISRWIFNRGSAGGELQLFKVIGATDNGVFRVYDCKRVQLSLGRFGMFEWVDGLFTQEGGGLWAQFLHFTRPPCEPGSRAPELHMFRCVTYPPEIEHMVEHQALASTFSRSEARWVRRGSESSMEGWIWSSGDGQTYWSEERGWHRLIQAHGTHGKPRS